MKIDSPTFLTETTFISASVQFSSGSQKFGNTSDDLHQFTGSQSTTGTGSFGSIEVKYPYRSSFPGGIDVGTFNAPLTQLILNNRGTQAAPAIAFSGDENTGIYQTTDNQLSIGVNNNQLVAMTYYNFDVKWNLRVGLSNDTFIGYDGKQISGSAISLVRLVHWL